MVRAIAAIFSIFIIAMLGIVGLQAGLEAAGDRVSITNETWTPSAGQVTTLDDSDIDRAFYDQNVTVRDENDTLMDRGTDYEWFEKNGSVKAVSGGGLDGDANATISYGYSLPTKEQVRLTEMMANIPQALGFMLPVLAFAAILIMLRGG